MSAAARVRCKCTSSDGGLTLSEHTKKILAGLNQPVTIIVFMGAQYLAVNETVELLGDYRATNPQRITFEYTDPSRSIERAKELETKYRLNEKENAVVIDAGAGNYTVITADKLVIVDPGDKATGREARITSFIAERVLTAALLDLIEGKHRQTYSVTGHGTASLAKGKPLDWDKGGRLLVLLNPETPTPHLAGFLTRLGVRPDDDRILGQASVLGVRKLLSGALTLFAGDTTMAVRLADLTPMFQGSTQSLSLTPEAGATSGLKVGPLLQTPKGFWGEVDYKDMENTGAENDPARDKQSPLIVAATVEKGAVGDQRVQVTASRLIVFGNARFVEPEVMDQQALDLFINSVNWLGEH